MRMFGTLRNASFLFIIFYFIFFGCGKKTIDKPQPSTSTSSVSPKSGARVQVSAPEPPAIISDDLAVPNENGANIGVITEADYNSLDYKDQIFYTGLRNSIAYLLANAANVATVLEYNADGSYTIVSNPDESDEEDADKTQICVQCGGPQATMLYNCIKKVKKYMEDSNKTEITVKVIKHKVLGADCITVIYRSFEPNEQTTTEGGAVEETYIPGAPPTFTSLQFDSFIQSTTLWYGSAHLPTPAVWNAADLYLAIDAFVNEELSPAYDVYSYATQQGFITALKSYVSTHY
jgi:hypothetical protein